MSAGNSNEIITHVPVPVPSFYFGKPIGGILKVLETEGIDFSRFIVASRGEFAIEVDELSNKIILYFLELGGSLSKKEFFFEKKTEKEFSSDFYRTSPFDAQCLSDESRYHIWIKNDGLGLVLTMTFETSIWKYYFSDYVPTEKEILKDFLKNDLVVGNAYRSPCGFFAIKPIVISDTSDNDFFLYKLENGQIVVFFSASAETVESCKEDCFPWSCQKSKLTLMVSNPKADDENRTDKLVVYRMVEKKKWLRVIFEKRSDC